MDCRIYSIACSFANEPGALKWSSWGLLTRRSLQAQPRFKRALATILHVKLGTLLMAPTESKIGSKRGRSRREFGDGEDL
jgi:hypothetical protein